MAAVIISMINYVINLMHEVVPRLIRSPNEINVWLAYNQENIMLMYSVLNNYDLNACQMERVKSVISLSLGV